LNQVEKSISSDTEEEEEKEQIL